MSGISISGLASGIDTTTLISQLMTAAAQPQRALKGQLSAQQTVLNAYQALNTRLTVFQAAADAVNQPSTWAATKATSNNAAVVASTTPSATAGTSTTFDVNQLATAQISTVAVNSDGTVDSNPSKGIDIVDGAGVSHHLDLSNGNAGTVASAVNGANLGLRAALINTGSGQVLQFSSTATGTPGSFSISGLDTTPATPLAAQNAQITVGNPAAGGYTVFSNTNTFANAIPGLTFSVGAIASAVTVSVSSDASTISGKMSSLIGATNDLLKTLTAATGQGAILESNHQINAITQSVLSAVSHGDGSGASFASIGLQLSSAGQLSFDSTAFMAAYASAPDKAQAAATSLASTLSGVARAASTSTVSPLISSATSQTAHLTKQISDWDTRLNHQQTTLKAKYASMEVALQKLHSTSSWLSSALGAANKSASGSNS